MFPSRERAVQTRPPRCREYGKARLSDKRRALTPEMIIAKHASIFIEFVRELELYAFVRRRHEHRVGGDTSTTRKVLNMFGKLKAALGRRMGPFVRMTRDERGTAAVEYGLLAALIAVAAVGVLSTVGTNLSSTFANVASKL